MGHKPLGGDLVCSRRPRRWRWHFGGWFLPQLGVMRNWSQNRSALVRDPSRHVAHLEAAFSKRATQGSATLPSGHPEHVLHCALHTVLTHLMPRQRGTTTQQSPAAHARKRSRAVDTVSLWLDLTRESHPIANRAHDALRHHPASAFIAYCPNSCSSSSSPCTLSPWNVILKPLGCSLDPPVIPRCTRSTARSAASVARRRSSKRGTSSASTYSTRARRADTSEPGTWWHG